MGLERVSNPKILHQLNRFNKSIEELLGIVNRAIHYSIFIGLMAVCKNLARLVVVKVDTVAVNFIVFGFLNQLNVVGNRFDKVIGKGNEVVTCGRELNGVGGGGIEKHNHFFNLL